MVGPVAFGHPEEAVRLKLNSELRQCALL